MEYAKFSGSSHDFFDPDCLRDRAFMEPKDWWVTYGSSTPNIQALTFKLLVQPCSSSCCERNWSTYSFIQSLKRNKLTPALAEDLVYVNTNLCLLSRSATEYKVGETRLWDIGRDGSETFQGAGILDVASFLLNEPTIEVVVFVEDEGGNED